MSNRKTATVRSAGEGGSSLTFVEQPTTAVIYVRVSTKEQAEMGGDPEGFSIPAQREACLRKAETMGAVVAAEFGDRQPKVAACLRRRDRDPGPEIA